MSENAIVQGDVLDTDKAITQRAAEGDGQIVASINRAEVDMQVATAKQYPRSTQQVLNAATDMATINVEVAAGCMYSLPRGGKAIEGPSVRLAEIMATAYKNLRAESRIIHTGEKTVTAEGVAWDLESNYAAKVQVSRRITGKSGKRFNDDMINVTCNAAMATAYRNAIFKVIPRALTDHVMREAIATAVGDKKTLAERRAKCADAFAKIGVSEQRLADFCDVTGLEDIGLHHIRNLLGVFTAIRDGDTTIEQAFGPKETFDAPEGKASKKIGFGKQQDQEKPAKQAAPDETPDPETKQKAADAVEKLKRAAKQNEKAHGVGKGDDGDSEAAEGDSTQGGDK